MDWMIVIVFAGIMTGTFGLPMKFTTAWKWENTWTMWTVWTLLFIPWTVGLLTIPDLFEVLTASGTGAVIKVFVLGMVWGISAIAFGFGIHYLGLGLGYSLMMGMIITIGSLYPVLTGAMGSVQTSSILAVAGAVLVIVIGVVFSAWAAVIREKDQSASTAQDLPEKKSFAKGVLICIVAGITAPFINFAFVYGNAISTSAVAHGAHVSAAPNAIWAVALSGGFVVNIVYTLFLVQKNGNWKLFRKKGTGIYFFYTFLMGLLWAGSIIIYGMGATNLGKLGASVGWAAFNATGILWANILGLLMKEWKGVGRKGMAVMILGLTLLLAGIFLVKLA
jgi:L-rhamnose-H+ transport protein